MSPTVAHALAQIDAALAAFAAYSLKATTKADRRFIAGNAIESHNVAADGGAFDVEAARAFHAYISARTLKAHRVTWADMPAPTPPAPPARRMVPQPVQQQQAQARPARPIAQARKLSPGPAHLWPAAEGAVESGCPTPADDATLIGYNAPGGVYFAAVYLLGPSAGQHAGRYRVEVCHARAPYDARLCGTFAALDFACLHLGRLEVLAAYRGKRRVALATCATLAAEVRRCIGNGQPAFANQTRAVWLDAQRRLAELRRYYGPALAALARVSWVPRAPRPVAMVPQQAQQQQARGTRAPVETDAARRARMAAEHFAKYEALAQRVGPHTIARHLPYTEAQISAALAAGDESLNTLPLAGWDSRDYHVRQALGVCGYRHPGGWSLGESVCLLKHVARHHVAQHPAPADADYYLDTAHFDAFCAAARPYTLASLPPEVADLMPADTATESGMVVLYRNRASAGRGIHAVGLLHAVFINETAPGLYSYGAHGRGESTLQDALLCAWAEDGADITADAPDYADVPALLTPWAAPQVAEVPQA